VDLGHGAALLDQETPGASGGANEVGPFWIGLPSGLGSGAGLVGGVLAAGGRACQHRPARSLHLGAVGERGSHHESRSGPFQATRDES
jgi:hypothetical protein